jgi:ubiquinone/menaquinone biosynthesis C-methylase UbiE
MSDLLELTAQAEASHFWFVGFRRFLSPVLQTIAAGRSGLRLIDCGCGTGNNITLLRPYGQVHAFDLTPFGAMRTRRSGCPVVRADMMRMPYLDNVFDVATSFDVVQSVPDDRLAVREIARVLKPGGYAVLNVTALEIMRADHAEVWQELRRYTPRSAARLVEDAGMEVVRISFLFASVFPLMLAVRLWQRLLRRFREPTGDSDMHVPSRSINAALGLLLRLEAVAVSRRIPMPVGSSLLIVARKRSGRRRTVG